MQTAILIANIGVRDPENKDDISFNVENALKESNRICENLDSLIKKIKASFNLEKIILFGTKQITPYIKDNFYITSIVKNILNSRYGIDEKCISMNDISHDPSDYIGMLNTYHREIEKIPSDINQVFVFTTSVIPQQKFFSIFELILKFNEKVMLLYRSQDTEEIVEYKIKKWLNSAKITIKIKNYKKAFNSLDNAKKNAKCADLQKTHYGIMNLKLEICEYLLEVNPENSFFGKQFVWTLNDLELFCINEKIVKEAKIEYERKTRILDDLLKKYPENKEFLTLIGSAYYNFGNLLSESGSIKEVKESSEKSLEIYESLLKKCPENKDYLTITSSIYCILGKLLSESGSIEEAIRRYGCALKIYIQLIEKYPENEHYYLSVLNDPLNVVIQLYFDCAESEINAQMKMVLFEKVINKCERYQDYYNDKDFECERKSLLKYKILSHRKFFSIHIDMQKKPMLSAEKCNEAIKKLKKIKTEVKDEELEKLCSSAIHCFQHKKRIFQDKKLPITVKDLQDKHYRSFVLNDIINIIQLRFNCAKNEEDTFRKMTLFMKVIYTCEQHQSIFIKNDFEYERKSLFKAKIHSQTAFYSNYIEIRNEYNFDLKNKKCEEAINSLLKVKKEVKDEELEKLCSSSIHYFQEQKLIFQGQKLINEAVKSKPPNLDFIIRAVEIFESIKDINWKAEKNYLMYTGYIKIEKLLSTKRCFYYDKSDENYENFLNFIGNCSHKLDNEIICMYKNISTLINCSVQNVQDKLVNLSISIEDVNDNELRILFKYIYRLIHKHFNIKEKKKKVRIGTAQIEFELSKSFPPKIKDKETTRDKIFKALDTAQREEVNIVCLPELCISEEWLSEIENRDSEMIVIAGSYYDEEGHNVCRIIMDSDRNLLSAQFKRTPSGFEDSSICGLGMVPGEKINIYDETPFGKFAVLICRDFGHCHDRLRKKVDILFVPSYNSANDRFHQHADSHVKDSLAYVVIANVASEGGTSIFGQMDRQHFPKLVNMGYKQENDQSLKLCELKKNQEGIIIADFNLSYKFFSKISPIDPSEAPYPVTNIRAVSLEGKPLVMNKNTL